MQKQQVAGSKQLNLTKIMGNLQTYKDKQNKRDPSRRVNMPYYRRVMSRNKYVLNAATAQPE